MEKDPGDQAQSRVSYESQIAKRGGPRPERRHQESAGARGGGAVIQQRSCQRIKQASNPRTKSIEINEANK